MASIVKLMINTPISTIRTIFWILASDFKFVGRSYRLDIYNDGDKFAVLRIFLNIFPSLKLCPKFFLDSTAFFQIRYLSAWNRKALIFPILRTDRLCSCSGIIIKNIGTIINCGSVRVKYKLMPIGGEVEIRFLFSKYRLYQSYFESNMTSRHFEASILR